MTMYAIKRSEAAQKNYILPFLTYSTFKHMLS